MRTIRSPRPRRFLSTPSSQRATFPPLYMHTIQTISIHALFAEGDLKRHRPWLLAIISIHALFAEGDSQPSAAACCIEISIHALFAEGDRSFPRDKAGISISIHALFAEGDNSNEQQQLVFVTFLSTPSSQRATPLVEQADEHKAFLSTPSSQRATSMQQLCTHWGINFYPRPLRRGRRGRRADAGLPGYFYPRPLRRGRRCPHLICDGSDRFLSTPSSQRATHRYAAGGQADGISIHALFAEGD